jgi:ABC-type polysaccharide/polyol phosphate export permease
MSDSAASIDTRPWPYEASNDDWLLPLQERRSLIGDLRFVLHHELWRHRGLLYELMRRDIRIRYKQAAMGLVWAVLMPILIVTAGALVRVAMAFVGGRPLVAEEVMGIAIKAVPWSFFVGALGFATNSLTGNANLVTKIYFPREVLPLAATLAQVADSAIGLTVLAIAGVVLGVHFGAAALWAPVLLVLLIAFTAGSALVVSCGNLFFRDVKYIVQVLLSFGIFFTPVFFEPEMFGPVGARLMMLNPLAPILEGLRLSVVYDHNLLSTLFETGRRGSVLVWTPWYLVSTAAWAIVMLMGGLLFFHRSEAKFAEYV